MKILQINTQDLAGGAAYLTYQMHRNYQDLGHDSKMLVGFKTSNDPAVTAVKRSSRRIHGIAEFLQSRAEDTVGLQYWFQRFPYGWLSREPYCSADVVNLHNIHGGYFNYRALPQMAAAKPTCWSLHDMWSFTGHCAYSYECERWKAGCKRCPLLSLPKRDRGLLAPEATLVDLTGFIWRVKKRLYSRSKIDVVVGSNWMKRQVERSILGEVSQIALIPDGTDVDMFRPIGSSLARECLAIPPDAPVVLLYTTPGNPRKGLAYAIDALNQLQLDPLPWVIAVGCCTPPEELDSRYQSRSLGYVQSDILRNVAYCAADVFLLPTLADNLPLTVLDSLAAGTPVVGFEVGGMPDAVREMESGYLAAYKDPADLARGIRLVLENRDLRMKMRQRCREIAVQEFSLKAQTARYIALYEELIANHKSRKAE